MSLKLAALSASEEDKTVPDYYATLPTGRLNAAGLPEYNYIPMDSYPHNVTNLQLLRKLESNAPAKQGVILTMPPRVQKPAQYVGVYNLQSTPMSTLTASKVKTNCDYFPGEYITCDKCSGQKYGSDDGATRNIEGYQPTNSCGLSSCSCPCGPGLDFSNISTPSGCGYTQGFEGYCNLPSCSDCKCDRETHGLFVAGTPRVKYCPRQNLNRNPLNPPTPYTEGYDDMQQPSRFLGYIRQEGGVGSQGTSLSARPKIIDGEAILHKPNLGFAYEGYKKMSYGNPVNPFLA